MTSCCTPHSCLLRACVPKRNQEAARFREHQSRSPPICSVRASTASRNPLFRTCSSISQQKQNDYYVARSRIGLAASQFMIHNYKAAVGNAEAALRYGLAYERSGHRGPRRPQSVERLSADEGLLRGRAKLSANSILSFRRSPIYRPRRNSICTPRPTSAAAATGSAPSHSSMRHRQRAADRAMFRPPLGLEPTRLHAPSARRSREGRGGLTEAFRLRRLAGNRNLSASYTYLGMLRLGREMPLSARNLLDNAIRLATRTDAAVPAYVLYYWRAKAKTATGDIAVRFEPTSNRLWIWPPDGARKYSLPIASE